MKIHFRNTKMTLDNKKVLTACYYALKNMFGTLHFFYKSHMFYHLNHRQLIKVLNQTKLF